ncbi:MAG: type 1 glutamine amidotransferase domain-containing protein [Chromatiales bacterium]|nr:MAG: type 1 glutamine amidotransferase domain-containing protein [Chromatiales bacterium]
MTAMNPLILSISVLLVAATLPAAAQHMPRVLMGVTNVAEIDNPEKHEAKNNLWEVAPAFHVFVMHGFEVDFVSPRGGPVPFSLDVDDFDPPGMVSYTIRYEGFREKANNSLSPRDVRPTEYAAYFVAGGLGPLFDVASDRQILAAAALIYENGGVIGGCGHGPGSLANISLPNGNYVVKGKKVTGFPNSSERSSRWSKQGTLLPFLVEDALRARGGLYQSKSDLADKFDVVVDQRLVTTMFMSSCANAAREIVEIVRKH